MHKSPTPPAPVDYAGRLAFLRATSQVWTPDPLTALLESAAPIWEWLSHGSVLPQYAALKSHMDLMAASWGRLENDPAPTAAAARAALLGWRDAHPFPKDEWVLDVALSTVWESERGASRDWFYLVRSSIRPRFTVPPLYMEQGETETSFRKRSRSTFTRALNDYCRKVRVAYGETSEQLSRDAGWTARRLAGKSWVSIAEDLTWHNNEPVETVRAAVRAFCQRVGITLTDRKLP